MLCAAGGACIAAEHGAAAEAGPPPTLEQCTAIGAATDRLICYDKFAGRAPAPTEPPASQPLPGVAPATPAAAAGAADAAAPASSLQATGALPQDAPKTAAETSLLSKYWELEPTDKRGIFNFVGFQPNYVLPVHVTDHINRAPQSPTRAAVAQPALQNQEAMFQLSLRTKVAQNFGLPGADLWLAFTQQAMWQIYNGGDSKPFRNTDYQPEVIYIVPTGEGLRHLLPFGWQWRYTQLGLAHQSNGQADPLSRSWNRVYLGGGFENGPWNFQARYNARLKESASTDDNPDLMSYRGHGEFQLGWAQGLQTATLQLRSSLGNTHGGAVQLAWTYPVFNDQPNGLRWDLQLFSGYGETLTDYNFKQTSAGIGVTFLQF